MILLKWKKSQLLFKIDFIGSWIVWIDKVCVTAEKTFEFSQVLNDSIEIHVLYLGDLGIIHFH